MPLSVTVMVSVIRPPIALSFVPKVYVGADVLLPAVNVPSPVVVQFILPFAAVYPGMVKDNALEHTVSRVIGPAVAIGSG